MTVTLLQGDCIEVMRGLDAESVDSCVTDPPYHLASIVKRFGSPDSAPAKSNGATGVYARESERFRGRNWDAGTIAFQPETWRAAWHALKPGAFLLAFNAPRNYHRMATAIEAAGFEVQDVVTWLFSQGMVKRKERLKPASELICMARKPFSGSLHANVSTHGVGAIFGDPCRIPRAENDRFEHGVDGTEPSRPAKHVYGEFKSRGAYVVHPGGRWPSNVIHDGSGAVLEELGERARFFYCAKATKAERAGSKHPTVKPIALMRYLCRLVTPPGGMVLDPFAGTGTTGQAAIEEGFNVTLIEREDEYAADIRRRLGLQLSAEEMLA